MKYQKPARHIEALESRVLLAGHLDTTFGVGGIRVQQLTNPQTGAFMPSAANATAQTLDGRILVAGSIEHNGLQYAAIARFTENGSIDTNWGVSGLLVANTADTVATALAVGPDGNVIVGGHTLSGDTPTGQDMIVWRLTSYGYFDTSFGSFGNGYLMVDASSVPSGDDKVETLLYDGWSIWLGGSSTVAGGTVSTVVRATTWGAVDTSFGNNGIVRETLGKGTGVEGMYVGPNQTLTTVSDQDGVLLARYDSFGQRDFNFGDQGYIADPTSGLLDVEDVAFENGGNGFYVIGYSVNRSGPSPTVSTRVFRYSTLGLPGFQRDLTFGIGGDLLVGAGGGGADVAIDAYGWVYAAAGEHSFGKDWAVVRASFYGILDSQWGTDGRQVVNLGNGTVAGLIVRNDGSAVIAGTSDGPQTRSFTLARLAGGQGNWQSASGGANLLVNVFNDANGNQWFDPGETLRAKTPIAIRVHDSFGKLLADVEVTSDLLGSYYFFNLPVDQVVFSTWSTEGVLTKTTPMDPVSLNSFMTTTVNLGVRATSTLAGVVFNDSNSNGVRDSGETAIAGRTITAWDSMSGQYLTATSAANGSYSIGQMLPTGTFFVTIDTPLNWGVTNPPGGSYYFSFNGESTVRTLDWGLRSYLVDAEPGGTYSGVEGTSIILSGSTSIGTLVAYEWDLNYDGSTFQIDATGITPTMSLTNIDGPAVRTIALRVRDNTGVSDIGTTTVTITNRNPTATVTGSNVNLGQASTVTFSNQADAAVDMAGLRYSYDFNNDGDYTDTGDILNSASASGSFTFTTTGTRSVRARISDNDGGNTVYTLNVTVNAVALPTVTVAATDASATEAAGNPGSFTITRTGATTSPLTVFYTLPTATGRATNGTDYVTLSGSVTIAGGQTSATVTVTPIDDTAVEGSETVLLSLTANAAYALGAAATQATVTITDNDTAPTTPPAAPSGIAGTVVSGNRIDVRWTDNANNESGFEIQRSLVYNFLSPTNVTVNTPNLTSYSDTTLSPNTYYYFRVRARNAAGVSAWSGSVKLKTSSSGTTPTVPAAPTSPAATANSSSQITVTWTDASNNETGFRIQRSSNSTFTAGLTEFTAGAGVTSFANTGLAAGTTYYYRVQAYNGTGPSAYTSGVSATTQSATPTIPSSPTSPAATANSSSQITLTWTDTSNNETGFRIQRSLTSNFSTFNEFLVGANVTSLVSTGLTANTTYYYRIQSENAVGASAYAPIASATTPSGPSAPAVPTGAQAVANSSSQITVTWTDASNNESGFRIQRSTAALFTSFTEFTVGAGVTSFANTGLTASTTYYYRVLAYNAQGDGNPSSLVSATTLAGTTAPAAPTSPAATANSSSQITVTWTDASNNETGFRIQRSTTSNFASVTTFTVGAGMTSFVNTGLTAGTTYYYRVQAYNGTGNSAYTAGMSATTLPTGGTGPLTAPSGLTGTPARLSTLLNWLDNSNNESGWEIQISTVYNFTPETTLTVSVPTANATSFNVTGLNAYTWYYFRIRAVNTTNISAWSGSVKLKTLA